MKLIIDSDYDKTTLEEIDRGLRFLLQVRQGTYPLDRGFGLSGDWLDMPAPQAANALAAELADVIEEQEPRVELDHVEMTYDLTGRLSPTIYLNGTGITAEELEEIEDEEVEDE